MVSGRGGWRNERGNSRLGCLFLLFLVVVAAYYAIPVGQAYFNYLSLRDEMRTQAQFAETLDDDTIRRRIVQHMDRLGVPLEAQHNLRIRRTERRPLEIIITTAYDVYFDFPFYQYRHNFALEARRPL